MRSAGDQARRRRRAGVALMLGVLVLGAAASWGGAATVWRSQDRLLRQAVTHDAVDFGTALDEKADRYQNALEDLAVAFASQSPPRSSDFEGMASNLTPDRLPGATSVSFVVPAFPGELAGVQATWRARGAKRLVLRPVGTRLDHSFVIFSRSIGDTADVPGRDVSASPDSADALRIAAETRSFTISRAHVLSRDLALPPNRRQMAFTIAVPVFDQAVPSANTPIQGWLVMDVRGGDFLDDVMADQGSSANNVSLADPASPGIAIATIATGTPIKDPRLVRDQTLLVGQHTWRVTIWPTTQAPGFRDRWSGMVTLFGGLAITLLLMALVGVLATARNRALDQVDVATAALREDIRRREAVERELQWLAFHDQLTGLANRGLFYDRVGQALRSHVRSGRHFAVFFIDLDGFKQVNDEYGHGVGDHVLREVAVRIRDCLRESDTAARFGGDEFAAILEGLAEPGDVHLTAARIIAAVQQPIDFGGREASVTASVGIALNRPGDTADDIMREADMAMYTAKTTGKSRHVVAGGPSSVDHEVSSANSDLSPN